MSCSQNRRPGWTIARPQSHAATGGLTPPTVRGTRPSCTASASSKLAVAARPSSPVVATDSQSDSPVHCVAVTSDDADLSGLMLLCAAAETSTPLPSHAGACAHLDKTAGLMLLCKAALGTPSPMAPTSLPHIGSSVKTQGGPASALTEAALSSPSQARLTPSEAAPCITNSADGHPASTSPDTSGSQGPRLVDSTAGAKGSAVQHDRPRGRRTARSPAATTGLSITAVAAPAARMLTRGQAAAAARQANALSASSGAPASVVRKQARSLKPQAPTRRQPQRTAKPQWR
ncbi:hypothetical protein ABBQ38_005080 [Trebouxia sp. C0009 RCD-2024]